MAASAMRAKATQAALQQITHAATPAGEVAFALKRLFYHLDLPQNDQRWGIALGAAQRRLNEMDISSVGVTATAIAKLPGGNNNNNSNNNNNGNNNGKTKLLSEIRTKALAALKNEPKNVTSADLGNLCTAFAISGALKSDEELLVKLFDAALERMGDDDCSCNRAVGLVSALVKSETSNRRYVNNFLTKTADLLVDFVPEMTTREITTVSHAFAKATVRHKALWHAISLRIPYWKNELTGPDVANIAQALGKVGIRDLKLFRMLAERASCSLENFEPRHLGCFVLAQATSGFRDEELLCKIGDRVIDCKLLPRFGAQELCNLLRGFERQKVAHKKLLVGVAEFVMIGRNNLRLGLKDLQTIASAYVGLDKLSGQTLAPFLVCETKKYLRKNYLSPDEAKDLVYLLHGLRLLSNDFSVMHLAAPLLLQPCEKLRADARCILLSTCLISANNNSGVQQLCSKLIRAFSSESTFFARDAAALLRAFARSPEAVGSDENAIKLIKKLAGLPVESADWPLPLVCIAAHSVVFLSRQISIPEGGKLLSYLSSSLNVNSMSDLRDSELLLAADAFGESSSSDCFSLQHSLSGMDAVAKECAERNICNTNINGKTSSDDCDAGEWTSWASRVLGGCAKLQLQTANSLVLADRIAQNLGQMKESDVSVFLLAASKLDFRPADFQKFGTHFDSGRDATLAVYGASLLSRQTALSLMPKLWRHGVSATEKEDCSQWYTALQIALFPGTNNLPWRLSDVERMSVVARRIAKTLAARTHQIPSSTFMASGVPFQKQVGNALSNVLADDGSGQWVGGEVSAPPYSIDWVLGPP